MDHKARERLENLETYILEHEHHFLKVLRNFIWPQPWMEKGSHRGARWWALLVYRLRRPATFLGVPGLIAGVTLYIEFQDAQTAERQIKQNHDQFVAQIEQNERQFEQQRQRNQVQFDLDHHQFVAQFEQNKRQFEQQRQQNQAQFDQAHDQFVAQFQQNEEQFQKQIAKWHEDEEYRLMTCLHGHRTPEDKVVLDAAAIREHALTRHLERERARVDEHRPNLRNVHLENTWLREQVLNEVNLRYAHLEEADLTCVNLSGSEMVHVNLNGSDCTQTVFEGANLTSADLTGANLTNADLHEANLSEVDTFPMFVNNAFVSTIRGNDKFILWAMQNGASHETDHEKWSKSYGCHPNRDG